ncbi:hypothetical protein A2773_02085 [Candidatus Gottesmanbacteria bacterium RIFCSPHIGHO2_01_FULL_39_10]|uniref:Uncharacterized protein n=1 Tax=Candidatus Gottesmanbacteria bacterium RIFCSPHIGHO2_01_FULL_39_10 TaxID=1798375 RepID=A0A1F5ZRE4_9BACT|nr:MAG: hypothetical protein A2773_02085 [Candidatus Gottesmanbacteria bacterium RIFCSPHIGHO2_01_FULL_39_10]
MAAQPKTLKINLLPREDFEYTFAGLFLKWALSYGRYIIIITQIIVLGVFFMRFKLDREHIDLKESIQQKQALFSSVAEVEGEIRKVQDRLAKIKSLEENQKTPVNILNFLQENTPVEVRYSAIDISNNKLVLKGSGLSLKSLSALLLVLKKSDKFGEISLDSVDRELDGSVIFVLTSSYNLESFRV